MGPRVAEANFNCDENYRASDEHSKQEKLLDVSLPNRCLAQLAGTIHWKQRPRNEPAVRGTALQFEPASRPFAAKS